MDDASQTVDIVNSILELGLAGAVLVVAGLIVWRLGVAALDRLFDQLMAQQAQIEKQDTRHDAAIDAFRSVVSANTAAMTHIAQEVMGLKLKAGEWHQRDELWHVEVRGRFDEQDTSKQGDHQKTMKELQRMTALMEAHQAVAEAEYKAAQQRFEQAQQQNKEILAHLRVISWQMQTNANGVIMLPAPKT